MSVDQEKEVFPFPGKVKSSVWEYFGFYKDDAGSLDKSKAICKLCRRAVNYTGNTTNLRAHVVHHHRGEEGVDEKLLLSRGIHMSPIGLSNLGANVLAPCSPSANLSQTGMLKTFGDIDSDCSSQKGESVNSALLDFIISELLPLDTFDCQSFRNLLKVCSGGKLDPQVPRIEDVSAMLYSNYFCEKQKVGEWLAKAEAEYMKVEIWKTVHSNYMTVGLQIIDDNWQTNSYVLCTYDLGETIASKDVSDFIGNAVQEWNLFEEMIILTDGHEEVNKAASKLSCVHIPSLGVSINKTAELCLKQPSAHLAVKHVRDIVAFFKGNSAAEAVLTEKQKVLKLPSQTLSAEDKNNWKSTLEMLESFNEISAAVWASLKDPILSRHKNVQMLTSIEVSFLQSLISLLKPLRMAFSLSHDMKYPLMSVILPVMKKLEVALTSNDCDSQTIIEVKEKMLGQLTQGYTQTVHRELLLLSSLLDPRYKDLKFVDQSEQELAYDLLQKSAAEVNMASTSPEIEKESPQEFCIKIEINDDHEFSSCSSEDTTAVAMLMDQLDQTNKPAKRRRHIAPQKDMETHTDPMNDWLADVVQEVVPSEKQEDTVTNEISRYRSELQILSTSSPLLWWKDRKKTYPILSQVAKKFACAPAIISNLSESRQTVYERQRASLSDNYLEMLVFLNANRKTGEPR